MTIPLRPGRRARARAFHAPLQLVANHVSELHAGGSVVLDGRYELRESIGSGGMARVFLGWDRQLQREVAIKLLREEFVSDSYHVSRFRREAQLLARLESHHVVPIYDSSFGREHCYIVLRRLCGETLEARVKRTGPLDSTSALVVMADALVGLSDLHAKNIIHRDIKASNILLDEEDRATLLDLGVALDRLDGSAATPPHHTVGTPEFMSPEQRATGHVDARSDLYQVGLALLYALTARRPELTGSGEMRLPASLPPRVTTILERALHHDPAQRYGSSQEMRASIIDVCREVETVEIEVASSQVAVDTAPDEAPKSTHTPTELVRLAPSMRDQRRTSAARARRRGAGAGRRGFALAGWAIALVAVAGAGGRYLTQSRHEAVAPGVEVFASATPGPQLPPSVESVSSVESVESVAEPPVAALAPTEITGSPAPAAPRPRTLARVARDGATRRDSTPTGRGIGARGASQDVVAKGRDGVPRTAEEFLRAARRDERNGAIEAAIAGYRRYAALSTSSAEAAQIRHHLRTLEATLYSGRHRARGTGEGDTPSVGGGR